MYHIFSESEFINKLYEVIYKLSGIANTQSARFKREWDANLGPLREEPHLVRPVKIEKEKFLEDIDYRIKVINTVKLSFEDGFHSIKSLLKTLYHSYFNDKDLFIRIYPEKDQLILKYIVAKKVLGDLVQYNQLDHETIPLKYNILARSFSIMSLRDLRDTEIQHNLKKINIEIELPKLKEIMDEIVEDGIINKERRGRYYFYKIEEGLPLSTKAEEEYKRTIRPLIEWPTQFWRSYYNIREINLTLDEQCPHYEFLNKVLMKAATQGYVACHYVFKNLETYFEKVRDSRN